VLLPFFFSTSFSLNEVLFKKKTTERKKKSTFLFQRKKKEQSKKKMSVCRTYVGLEYFRGYRFILDQNQWPSINEEECKYGCKIAPSTIPDAGNGVFATQDFTRKGEYIVPYYGELLDHWQYDCLDQVDTNYTGVDVIINHEPAVFRGIPNMLASSINDCKCKEKANVYLEVDWDMVDEVKKEIYGNGFMRVRAKKPIQMGEELFLFYGQVFWENFTAFKGIQSRNDYCSICVEEEQTDILFICDQCDFAYHEACLKKHCSNNLPNSDPLCEWICFNCQKDNLSNSLTSSFYEII
jgi:hypothetical protein